MDLTSARATIEKPITIAEVKKILNDEKKERGEQTYEQKVSLEYAKEFATRKASKVEDVKQKLIEMGMDEKMAVKVIDILPENETELNLLFEKERFEVKEHAQELLDLIAQLR